MGQTPHYFIAIPIKEALRVQFANWQSQLKAGLSYKVWPHEQDLHITLKFLGAVEEEKLEKLLNSLRLINQTGFSLNVGGLGTFGKQDSPRVLWAGVNRIESLDELFLKVEKAALSAGFPKENRPYRPHITLAKKWNGTPEQTEILKVMKDKFQSMKYSMDIEEYVLYQIFPTKTPKYERVETFRLKRGESFGPIN
ncbi:RNA 2',3'-cyclic phosphodiesterase [Ornithinibacillus scapharcae]|uniref:RNA 2',3'-cyclic phosphodiesterase n=1 Tax=Ornithinibacillus scapharcae TaxID=1147159 RepID=UPI000225ADF5|nr:RNA 2',3'-cyclic phosphodiesterase [Ornithinibacillus scapharcae]